MSVIIILVIVGIIVAGGFLLGFIWAVRNGQYDDMYSPGVRVLFEDPGKPDPEEQIPDSTKGKEKTTISDK
ncbi:MAG: cbb3-type cytochrome oxidase assembly protein CcoS [Bacteroidetes bacterium]|nr:cbb3-type cytochrome oxidase assembly protein CcoS [Bacteroidota bacterium]